MADTLLLTITPEIDRFIGLVAIHQEGVREEAEQYRTQKTIPWRALKKLHEANRAHGGEQQTLLHELCRGSAFVIEGPKPRVKSKALQERLQKLQEDLDNQRYDAMVADITEKERAAAEARNSILPTFRLQASFGLHVIVTMFTFSAIGWYAGKVSFGSSAAAGLGGALGLTFGLLVETLLLIIRSNRPEPLLERMPHLNEPVPIIGPHATKATSSGSAAPAAAAGAGSTRPKQE